MASCWRAQPPRASDDSSSGGSATSLQQGFQISFVSDLSKEFFMPFTLPTTADGLIAEGEGKNSQGALEAPTADGGLHAWLQVLGGYFLFFNTWGLINAFGVFVTYYKEELIPSHSNSSIAWIGTLTSFLLCASPITWGPAFDLGSARLLVAGGSVAVVFGLMMTSLCREYWQLMLAQGVCCGVGGGCLFLTATAIIPSYFSRRRALALGLAASGSSLGGIIYPIVFARTHAEVGFGWSVRVIAFVALATLAIPCAVIRPHAAAITTAAKPIFCSRSSSASSSGINNSNNDRRRQLYAAALCRDTPYHIFNLATFLGFVGQYIPFFFIQQYSAAHHLGLGTYALVLLNAGSIPGRILPALAADRLLHPLGVLFATTLAATLLAFAWIAVQRSAGGLAVWCLLYGLCSGAFVALQGAVVARLTADVQTMGTRFGFNMLCGAAGILVGSPVAGAIMQRSWAGAQAFCGAALALSACAVAATALALRRRTMCAGRDRA